MLHRFSIEPKSVEWTGKMEEACRTATAGLHVVRSWQHGAAYWVDVHAETCPSISHPLLIVGHAASGTTEDDLNEAIRAS